MTTELFDAHKQMDTLAAWLVEMQEKADATASAVKAVRTAIYGNNEGAGKRPAEGISDLVKTLEVASRQMFFDARVLSKSWIGDWPEVPNFANETDED